MKQDTIKEFIDVSRSKMYFPGWSLVFFKVNWNLISTLILFRWIQDINSSFLEFLNAFSFNESQIFCESRPSLSMRVVWHIRNAKWGYFSNTISHLNQSWDNQNKNCCKTVTGQVILCFLFFCAKYNFQIYGYDYLSKKLRIIMWLI